MVDMEGMGTVRTWLLGLGPEPQQGQCLQWLDEGDGGGAGVSCPGRRQGFGRGFLPKAGAPFLPTLRGIPYTQMCMCVFVFVCKCVSACVTVCEFECACV